VWGRMVTRNGSETLFKLALEKPYVLSVIFSIQPPNCTYD